MDHGRVHNDGMMTGISLPSLITMCSNMLARGRLARGEVKKTTDILLWAETRLASNRAAFRAFYGRNPDPLWDGNGRLSTVPDQEGAADGLA